MCWKIKRHKVFPRTSSSAIDVVGVCNPTSQHKNDTTPSLGGEALMSKRGLNL